MPGREIEGRSAWSDLSGFRHAVGPPRSAPDSAERMIAALPRSRRAEPRLAGVLIAAADRPEEAVEGVSPDAAGEQSMLGAEPVLLDRSQRVGDIGERVENEPRYQKGIVYLNARQRRFPCYRFDKRMVGVFRIGTQVERVDGGKVGQDSAPRACRPRSTRILFNEVVGPKGQVAFVGRLLECGKGPGEARSFSPRRVNRVATSGAYRPDRIDAVSSPRGRPTEDR